MVAGTIKESSSLPVEKSIRKNKEILARREEGAVAFGSETIIFLYAVVLALLLFSFSDVPLQLSKFSRINFARVFGGEGQFTVGCR